MKKIHAWFGLICFLAALLFPAAVAQAKEIPADGKIPLTSEYFPNEWFLKYRAQTYDKDKNGYLSPDEIAEVTALSCAVDLQDLTSIQYFTNLRELKLDRIDEVTFRDGVWVGTDIDLTVFPNLESVYISLDTGKAPAGSPKVQIKASGLTHLKSIQVVDEISGTECNFDGSNAKIDVIDLRGTPALETVKISDAEGVIFDDNNQIRDIQIINMQEIPSKQIGTFRELERLYIWANLPDYTSQDVSQNHALTNLEIKNDYLKTVALAGADLISSVTLESRRLTDIDFSKNRNLARICLDCPMLETLHTEENTKLYYLTVSSTQLHSIDIRKNVELETLSLICGELNALDIGQNKNLDYLYLYSNVINKLDLRKNKKLTDLSVLCKRVNLLNLSGNTKLSRLVIDKTPVSSLNLSKQKKLTALHISNNHKLKRLDLSCNEQLHDLTIENTWLKTVDTSKQKKLRWFLFRDNKKLAQVDLQNNKSLIWLVVNGSKKLTALDLANNRKLQTADVKNNALKTLKLGSKPSMKSLDCSKNKLTLLDLSKATFLQELICDKEVKVKGYKGKIKRI